VKTLTNLQPSTTIFQLSGNYAYLSDLSSPANTLAIQAGDPTNWVSSFGFLVRQNSATATNFDLEVVYSPGGVALPIAVENFTNLSLTTTASNYAGKIINSNFFTVQNMGAPPSGNLNLPTAYPSAPVPLSFPGTTLVQDLGGNSLLTLQADPLNWPANFGVEVQGTGTAGDFDISVVYNPATGGGGETLPVTLESFNNLTSLANAATTVNSESNLVSVSATFPSTSGTVNFPVDSLVGLSGTSAALEDASSTPQTILNLVASDTITTNPPNWFTYIGVSVRANATTPTNFDLEVVYSPQGGGLGVDVPVTLELFQNLIPFNSASMGSVVSQFIEVSVPTGATSQP
ncbi:MAG TPA: hypothetical protein VN963_00740, partial [bacterium]|nr:hypothetical protein [bacterium]